jgi:hypothetical protein
MALDSFYERLRLMVPFTRLIVKATEGEEVVWIFDGMVPTGLKVSMKLVVNPNSSSQPSIQNTVSMETLTNEEDLDGSRMCWETYLRPPVGWDFPHGYYCHPGE